MRAEDVKMQIREALLRKRGQDCLVGFAAYGEAGC
jgi:hypothetical protein